MIRYEQIAETCRYMDAQADEGIALEEIARQRGVDLDDLTRAAMQRALRIGMIISGQDPRKLSKTHKTAVDLPPETRELLVPLQLAFLDGFIAGHSTTDPNDRIQRFPNAPTGGDS
jgi:hypothetical protein